MKRAVLIDPKECAVCAVLAQAEVREQSCGDLALKPNVLLQLFQQQQSLRSL